MKTNELYDDYDYGPFVSTRFLFISKPSDDDDHRQTKQTWRLVRFERPKTKRAALPKSGGSPRAKTIGQIVNHRVKRLEIAPSSQPRAEPGESTKATSPFFDD